MRTTPYRTHTPRGTARRKPSVSGDVNIYMNSKLKTISILPQIKRNAKKITACCFVEYGKPILKLTWRTKGREELKFWRTKNWGNRPYKRRTIFIKAQALGQANAAQALTVIRGTELRRPTQTVNMWKKECKVDSSQSSQKSRVWKHTTTGTHGSFTEHKEASEVYAEIFNRDNDVRGQSEKRGVSRWLTCSMRWALLGGWTATRRAVMKGMWATREGETMSIKQQGDHIG